MKVFATDYLETMSSENVNTKEWSWNPSDSKVKEIYACGTNTSSNTSTYAAEKDNRSDSDRPNEGMFVA